MSNVINLFFITDKMNMEIYFLLFFLCLYGLGF